MSPQVTEEIVACHKAGMLVEEIGERLEVELHIIAMCLKKENLKPRYDGHIPDDYQDLFQDKGSDIPENMMTASEAASCLGLSMRQVYQRAKKGLIPATKKGRDWRFKKEDIHRIGSS